MKLPSYVQCEAVFYRACAKILFWIILASNYTHLQWLIAQYTGDLTAHSAWRLQLGPRLALGHQRPAGSLPGPCLVASITSTSGWPLDLRRYG